MWSCCHLLCCLGFTFIQPFCTSCLEKILQHLLKSWFGGAENSLSFCLSVKLLNSPSYLNEILAGYSNLGYSLSLLEVCPAIPFWPGGFLLIDQLLSLWQSLCVLFVVSPLLLLIFVFCVWSLLIWLICVLGCFVPCVYPVWDSGSQTGPVLDLCKE